MKGRSMARGVSHGLITQVTKANLSTTTSAAMASTGGRITVATKVNGKTTKCTDMASLIGQTAASMKDSTLKTKKREKEFLPGLMAAATRDLGRLASNTAKARLSIDRASKRLESGLTASGSGGTMKLE